MNASVLVAFGGVFLFAVIGAVLVWILQPPVGPEAGGRALQSTLERIERDAHHARELLGVKR